MDRGDLNNSPYVRHLLHTGTHADAPAYADDFPALHINLARMLRGVPRHTRLPSQVGLVLTCAACRATCLSRRSCPQVPAMCTLIPPVNKEQTYE